MSEAETQAQRLAAAAPKDHEADDELADALAYNNAEVDELMEQWSTWKRSKRFICPPQNMGNIIGKLRGSSRPSRPAPDARLNSFMFALNLAIQGQPRDALDTQVFWLYYGERVNHIKQAADVLGISRQHFYRLRNAFAQRVIAIANQIEADNLAAGDALPHRNSTTQVDRDGND